LDSPDYVKISGEETPDLALKTIRELLRK